MLHVDVLRSHLFGGGRAKARRLLLTVLGRRFGITTGILGRINVACHDVCGCLVDNANLGRVSSFVKRRSTRRFRKVDSNCASSSRSSSSSCSSHQRSPHSSSKTNSTRPGSPGSAPMLSGFNASVAHTTTRGHLSPVIKHRGRVRHLTRVLDHHGGGGPILVNRPNINGSTVIRNLTLHVVRHGISHILFSGHIVDLSVTSVITKAGCHNRFRRHVGTVLGRLSGGPGVVLFVSRVRAVINTNSTSNSVSTTGVLGPTLTHNRVRYVNTAALSRCHGGVRGSKTLRHHFRGIVISPAATRRALRVLRGVGTHCRRRRGIVCAPRTLRTYMGLARHCVDSHGFPSGTVSTLSRTNSHMRVSGVAIPGDVRRLRTGVRTAGARGLTTIGSRGFRLTTDFHSGRHRCLLRLRTTGTG